MPPWCCPGTCSPGSGQQRRPQLDTHGSMSSRSLQRLDRKRSPVPHRSGRPRRLPDQRRDSHNVMRGRLSRTAPRRNPRTPARHARRGGLARVDRQPHPDDRPGHRGVVRRGRTPRLGPRPPLGARHGVPVESGLVLLPRGRPPPRRGSPVTPCASCPATRPPSPQRSAARPTTLGLDPTRRKNADTPP